MLGAGLPVERSFRWVSLLHAGAINLALITPGHYSINLVPWLLRRVPRHPTQSPQSRRVMVPMVFPF